MSDFIDYYEVLEVSPVARQSVIEKAYRALMNDEHPDHGGDTGRAQLINEAYRILRDPGTRRDYDQSRASAAGPSLDPGGDVPGPDAESGHLLNGRPLGVMSANRSGSTSLSDLGIRQWPKDAELVIATYREANPGVLVGSIEAAGSAAATADGIVITGPNVGVSFDDLGTEWFEVHAGSGSSLKVAVGWIPWDVNRPGVRAKQLEWRYEVVRADTTRWFRVCNCFVRVCDQPPTRASAAAASVGRELFDKLREFKW